MFITVKVASSCFPKPKDIQFIKRRKADNSQIGEAEIMEYLAIIRKVAD